MMMSHGSTWRPWETAGRLTRNGGKTKRQMAGRKDRAINDVEVEEGGGDREALSTIRYHIDYRLREQSNWNKDDNGQFNCEGSLYSSNITTNSLVFDLNCTDIQTAKMCSRLHDT